MPEPIFPEFETQSLNKMESILELIFARHGNAVEVSVEDDHDEGFREIHILHKDGRESFWVYNLIPDVYPLDIKLPGPSPDRRGA